MKKKIIKTIIRALDENSFEVKGTYIKNGVMNYIEDISSLKIFLEECLNNPKALEELDSINFEKLTFDFKSSDKMYPIKICLKSDYHNTKFLEWFLKTFRFGEKNGKISLKQTYIGYDNDNRLTFSSFSYEDDNGIGFQLYYGSERFFISPKKEIIDFSKELKLLCKTCRLLRKIEYKTLPLIFYDSIVIGKNYDTGIVSISCSDNRIKDEIKEKINLRNFSLKNGYLLTTLGGKR